MSFIRFRGKSYWRITEIREIAKGHVEAVFNGDTYKIDGGRSTGGTNREWFLSGPEFTPYINCTSIADALRLLETL